MSKVFIFLLHFILLQPTFAQNPRARDIGIPFLGTPGKFNAITDVPGVEIGYSTIITGSGNKAFVAGADISEFSGLSQQQGMALAKKGQDIFFRIENCSKPVVAAVNGFALGGGCELSMACHFRIASENAKFGQPEVNLGLIPGYGGTQRLVHLIGKGRALELLAF